MNNDEFTEFARSELKRALSGDIRISASVMDIMVDMAERSRDIILNPEPTDDEVEAAAQALAYWDGADGWETSEWTGEITESAYRHGARKALNAARQVHPKE